jgi:outer membrane protein OmpA-like peptidoglycan-associated protein
MSNKFKLSTALCTVLALSGCTTLDPYSGESKRSNASSGAMIGAAVGVLAGVLTGDNAKERKKRALKMAGIGAVAGGGVGYYMDVQEAKLRKELEATGVSVTRNGDNITLNMPGNITFDVNQSGLKPSFKPVLSSVSKVLQEYKSTIIQVAGHTDSDGSDSYNELLSKQRAQSVTNELLSLTIDPVRIETVGFGESYPIASNDTQEGKAMNRRVELTLVPVSEE